MISGLIVNYMRNQKIVMQQRKNEVSDGSWLWSDSKPTKVKGKMLLFFRCQT